MEGKDSVSDRAVTREDFYRMFGQEEPFWFVRYDDQFIMSVEGPCCLKAYSRNGSPRGEIVHYRRVMGGADFPDEVPMQTLLRWGVFADEADAVAYVRKIQDELLEGFDDEYDPFVERRLYLVKSHPDSIPAVVAGR